MKKKNIAVIALAVLLISAAGCSKAADTTPVNPVSIITTETTVNSTETEQGTESTTTDTQVTPSSTEPSSEQESSQTTSESSVEEESSELNTTVQESSQPSQSENSTSSAVPQESKQETSTVKENTSSNTQTVTASFTANTGGIIDTTDLFSNRDLLQTPDLSDAKSIQVSDGQTINITEAGTYVISGTANNCTIKVEADKESKVQLVLDGVTITNSNSPAIYVVSADKCFITTTDSTNTLSVTGTFTSDGDTNTDAVIFSKDDLVFNGLGTLTISSSNNGISGKDDIKFTGGTYNITSVKDSVEANDSIAICDGTFNITSSKDAFHSENDDDNTSGWIYISDGTFNIQSASDGIQGTSAVQIDNGTLTIQSSEGIEATYVQINGGTIDITASDDGINAAKKSTAYSTPTIEINGGYITIVMGQGDTDAIDANGNIIVNGGTIDITAQMSSFDYDGTAQYNDGTIIINGSLVNAIPQSMMGGGRGGMMGGQGNMGRFRI